MTRATVRRSDVSYLLQRERLERELQRADAPDMFIRFVQYVRPQYTFKWFHRLIADKCQQLYEGTLGKRGLMVFIPPQHSKSTIISQCLPAWLLGKDPDLKIVGASYSSDLATQFSRTIQRTMDSEEYQDIFPATYLNNANVRNVAKGYLRNVDTFEPVGHAGFYKAVGIGGSLTGTPADIAIIDDPVKDKEEAYSATYRERAWDWYNNVLLTRLHNNSKILFVMTRWHEDDLAGRILQHEREKWEVIVIPAICEQERDGELRSPRHVGDALWEEMHSRESILAQRKNSERTFCALYQQHPTVEGGNIVKREWFKFVTYEDFKALHDSEPIHFYLDTAYEKRDKKRDNDPSGIIAVCYINGDLYILNAHRVWMDMPELLRFLPEYVERHAGRFEGTLYVEPKANGISVIQMLQRNTRLKVHRTQSPKDSKETRLSVASFSIEAGRVFLVRGEWNEGFIDEVCGFPSRPHDEYCDILGYAVKGMDDPRNKGIDYSKIGRMSFT